MRQNQAEQTEQFQATARAIGEHLEGWTYRRPHEDYPQHNAFFDGPDGATFYLHLDVYRGKVETRPQWPKDDGRYMSACDWGALGYNEPEPTCGFTLKRTPEALARDIGRRFLSEFVRIHSKVMTLRDQRTEDRAKAAKVAESLANTLGTATRRNEYETHVDFPVGFEGYGNVTVTDSSTVTLHVRSVSPHLAQAIAQTIANHHNATQGGE